MSMSTPLNMIWSPSDYREASFLVRETGEELLSRLEWLTLQPQVVLDAGCGLGEMSVQLQARYSAARVVALDNSDLMIQHAREQTKHPRCLCADAGKLPLPDHSVDIIFAHWLLPWHSDVKALLKEWRRVLRPDGILMFSALGPDTLKEMHQQWGRYIIPGLMDMHDCGDLMLQEGFADPVLDVNHYTVSYRDHKRLVQELCASGMLANPDTQLAANQEGTWDVTYEVVFAHAFAPPLRDEVSASEDGVVRIPLSHLRRRRG